MAWNIQEAGEKVIQLLKKRDVAIDSELEKHLRSSRHVKFFGYNCMVANVMSLSSFRVRVSPDWFLPKKFVRSKPNFRNTLSRNGFDFQLIPTNNYLYALYYLELRDYTLRLERDRDRWFHEPWWGIRVDEDNGTFVWKGGNTIFFPLTPFCCQQALSIREKQYLMEHTES